MRTIADHVLDIVGNSVEANATRIEIVVDDDCFRDIYMLEFIDNGRGMPEEVVQQVTSPFFTTRTTRKAGLGLSLLKQNTTATHGDVTIQSEVGKGTSVRALFRCSHVDRPPAGDLPEVLYLILAGNPQIRVIYRHTTPAGSFVADSSMLRQLLNGVSLQNGEIKQAIIAYFRNNLMEIKASK